MIRPLDISEFLSSTEECVLIDVRSESEFASGHIPGAVNIPMLNDEERKAVGTTYKQSSREAAVYKGLELTGPYLSKRLKQAVKLIKDKPVVVHCWRGGMRSEFFAFMLHYYGLEPNVIKGGYKAYRGKVHEEFTRSFEKIRIVGGKTGTGKTKILAELETLGQQVLDLEELAKHRGSAFGSLAFDGQPTQEQFENDLFDRLRSFNRKEVVWIEDEGRTIGSKVIPEGLWNQMRNANRIVLEKSFDERLDEIVLEYGKFKAEDLASAMQRIGKRLGPQHVKHALELLQSGDIRAAFAIALVYYDRSYDFLLSMHPTEKVNALPCEGQQNEQIAQNLIKLYGN